MITIDDFNDDDYDNDTYLPAPNLINNLIKSFFVFTLTPLLLLLLRSLNRLKIGVSPIHEEKDDE